MDYLNEGESMTIRYQREREREFILDLDESSSCAWRRRRRHRVNSITITCGGVLAWMKLRFLHNQLPISYCGGVYGGGRYLFCLLCLSSNGTWRSLPWWWMSVVDVIVVHRALIDGRWGACVEFSSRRRRRTRIVFALHKWMKRHRIIDRRLKKRRG